MYIYIFFPFSPNIQSNLLVIDEKYPHIVYVERESSDDTSNKATAAFGDPNMDLEGLILHTLSVSPFSTILLCYVFCRNSSYEGKVIYL